MSIRLDPRRLQTLKQLAAEVGLRPGELVTRWVEARIDAGRFGETAAVVPAAGRTGDADAIHSLSARVDELARRLDALQIPTTPTPPTSGSSAAASVAPRRRGRPPKAASATPAAAKGTRTRRGRRSPKRVPLHEELAAILAERGEPLSAADLARAVIDRARYVPPRSAKALDAAAINSRVSNPHYRARFVRAAGRIGLAAASE